MTFTEPKTGRNWSGTLSASAKCPRCGRRVRGNGWPGDPGGISDFEFSCRKCEVYGKAERERVNAPTEG